MSLASSRDGRLLSGRSAHRLGRGLDGLDDVHVAGAAAEVALEAPPDLLVVRVRVLREQVGRGHDEARRAVAALQAVLVPECLLDRVELAVLGHALDGGEVLALRLDGEERAALDGLAVDEDRARAALAGVRSEERRVGKECRCRWLPYA